MKIIDIAIVDALIREGLPRATDEEVAFIMARCEGRRIHRDNLDLLRPFRPRDNERSRRGRVEMLIGCLLTKERNGWYGNTLRYDVRLIIEEAGARTA